MLVVEILASLPLVRVMGDVSGVESGEPLDAPAPGTTSSAVLASAAPDRCGIAEEEDAEPPHTVALESGGIFFDSSFAFPFLDGSSSRS